MLSRRHPSSSRLLRRAWLLLFVAVRVFAVVLGLQFSGFIHGVADVVDAVVAEHEVEHEQCPADGPCDDCPPGCPNCHCSAAATSVVPEVSAGLLTQLSPDALPPCLDATQAPSGPERPSLFRPPRA